MKQNKGSGKINMTSKYMVVSMVANSFLSILKIAFGLIANMKSLIADGIHSFSDLSTDVIAIIGGKLSLRPADKDHPKGHGNIEYITSLIISVFIIVLGVIIFKNSFENKNTIPNIYLAIVEIATIIIKYGVSALLIKKGKEYNNMILLSSGRESYTDVFSSLLVLFIIVISQFYSKFPILKYSDMIGSMIISIMIFVMGVRLLLENLSLLIGESEQSTDKIELIERVINNREDEFILDDLTVFKLGSYYDVSLKILVDGDTTVKSGHDLMDRIERDLLKSKLNVKYVTIHIEPK